MLFSGVVLAARAVGNLSRLLGRGAGAQLPGRVAIALAPDSLQRLTAERIVALISGTNGKTTTTRFLAAAAAVRGPVVSNGTGSNLESGLVSALLHAPRDAVAVLEVDEVALVRAIAATAPAVILLLNLSRDQLDRTSEVAMHVGRWGRALQTSSATVIANADDPLVVLAVRRGRPDESGVVWVAGGQPWRADSPLCPSCGQPWALDMAPWHCAQCGFARPTPTWSYDEDDLVAPDGSRHALGLALPGRANRSNAAMATAGASVWGVSVDDALARIRPLNEVEGRYLNHTDGRHEVRLLLAKNPAGWLEALSEVTKRRTCVVLAVNSRSADGIDPSWLWDVPFEVLRGQRVVVTGERAADIATRLHYAEVAAESAPGLLQAISSLPEGTVDVVANYTAFVQARHAIRHRS